MNHLSLFVLLAPLLINMPVTAQQPFSDGEIIYSVKVDLPPGGSPQAANAFQNSRLIFTFKNYLFRSDMSLGKTTYVTIHNSRDHSAVSLIDAGPEKYLIRMNAEDWAKETADYKGLTFTNVSGSMEIAGYKCQKAVGKMKDGNTFTVYYAPQLIPENSTYSERFEGLKGLPLSFETNTPQGIKMTMTATSVNISQQPSSKFDTPSGGYREITYAELENLRKNK